MKYKQPEIFEIISPILENTEHPDWNEISEIISEFLDEFGNATLNHKK